MRERGRPAGCSREGAGEGSVLIAVLWCFVILGAAVISMLHTTMLELRVVKNHSDLIQARYLALAGIEKAKALIYQESRRLEAEGKSFSPLLLNDPQDFREVPLGRGRFSVLRPPGADEDTGQPIYGLIDEGSRLNANAAGAEELVKLPAMTEDIAAAIIDWRDADGVLTPRGAEQDHYSSLAPPYRCRNGPLESVLELLMVRGITPADLLGERGRAGDPLDPREEGFLDGGWSDLLTVDSSVLNVDSRGKPAVDIQTASEDSLTALDGVGADLAKAIVDYRKEHKLETIADLLDVVPVQKREGPQGNATPPQNPPAQPAPPGETAGPGAQPVPLEIPQPPPPQPPPQPPPPAQPGGEPQGGGQKLVSPDLLKRIAGDISVDTGIGIQGLVNINTARPVVLSCLPGIEQELAGAIAAHREQHGPFSNIAELLDVPGMTQEIFKKVCPRITARCGTYRIRSEGLVLSTGARKRLEAVVRLGEADVDTLYFREDP